MGCGNSKAAVTNAEHEPNRGTQDGANRKVDGDSAPTRSRLSAGMGNKPSRAALPQGPSPDSDDACMALRDAADMGPEACVRAILELGPRVAEFEKDKDCRLLLIGRARELVAAMDVVLGPVVAAIEAGMTERDAFATGSLETLASVCSAAGSSMGGLARDSIAVSLKGLCALWDELVEGSHAEGAAMRLLPNPSGPIQDSFVSVRLGQIMAMAGVVTLRDVTARAPDWYQQRVSQACRNATSASIPSHAVEAMLAVLGASMSTVTVSLAAPAKLFLWYLGEGAGEKEEKVKVTASRERVGQAMLRVLNRISALMCQEERRRCILFPLFVDEYIESSKKRSSLVRAEGSMGSGNFMMSMQSGNFKTAFGSVMEDNVVPELRDEMVVDAGEGHGPRKELFALYGKTVYAGSGGDVRSAMQSMAAKQMMAKGWGRDPMEPIRLLEWHTGASACWFSRRTKGRVTRGDVSESEFGGQPYPVSLRGPSRSASRGVRSSSRMREDHEGKESGRLLGWMVGLSLHNRAPLGLPLPALLIDVLANSPKIIPEALPGQVRDFDPELAQGMESVLKMGRTELRGILAMEDYPSDMTAAEYAAISLQEQLVHRASAVIMDASSEGFIESLGGTDGVKHLRVMRVTCADIARVAGGEGALEEDDFDFRDTFRVVHDPDLMKEGEGALLRDALWEVVHSWDADLKRQFLKFVTGSDRLPAPMSESLKVEMPFTPLGKDEWQAMLGMVPQSHTCTNTLELPDYLGALKRSGQCQESELKERLVQILEDRFKIALANAYAYGLDTLGS